ADSLNHMRSYVQFMVAANEPLDFVTEEPSVRKLKTVQHFGIVVLLLKAFGGLRNDPPLRAVTQVNNLLMSPAIQRIRNQMIAVVLGVLDVLLGITGDKGMSEPKQTLLLALWAEDIVSFFGVRQSS